MLSSSPQESPLKSEEPECFPALSVPVGTRMLLPNIPEQLASPPMNKNASPSSTSHQSAPVHPTFSIQAQQASRQPSSPPANGSLPISSSQPTHQWNLPSAPPSSRVSGNQPISSSQPQTLFRISTGQSNGATRKRPMVAYPNGHQQYAMYPGAYGQPQNQRFNMLPHDRRNRLLQRGPHPPPPRSSYRVRHVPGGPQMPQVNHLQLRPVRSSVNTPIASCLLPFPSATSTPLQSPHRLASNIVYQNGNPIEGTPNLSPAEINDKKDRLCALEYLILVQSCFGIVNISEHEFSQLPPQMIAEAESLKKELNACRDYGLVNEQFKLVRQF